MEIPRQTQRTEISETLGALAILPDPDRGPDLWIPTVTRWSYSILDPLVLNLDFVHHPDNRWALPRDLIEDGLDGPSGGGEVSFRPVGSLGSKRFVALSFPADNPEFQAWVSWKGLGRVLGLTYDMVPRGSENLDVDSALAEIFGLPNS